MLLRQFRIWRCSRVATSLLLVLYCGRAFASTDPVVIGRFMSAVAQGQQRTIRQDVRARPQLLSDLSRTGKTALQLAIENRHLVTVRALLKFGADPDQSAQGKLRPIHLAVISSQLHVLHLLLREGVTLEARDAHGTTALMYAVRQDNELLAKTLLRAGARVDGLVPGNWSPLMQAALQGSQGMVSLLLQYGAFRERISVYGMTAAQAAEKKGFQKLARLLRPDQGAVRE
ncbi:MAG TPA: ankyrin repeat domain-containing protein [Gammaproteobacteria bacterium]|nr:ankyrin repeat domain-containing protein [Gammaproteobacteria bacterium]